MNVTRSMPGIFDAVDAKRVIAKLCVVMVIITLAYLNDIQGGLSSFRLCTVI